MAYCLGQKKQFLINNVIDQKQHYFQITLRNLCQKSAFFELIQPFWQCFQATVHLYTKLTSRVFPDLMYIKEQRSHIFWLKSAKVCQVI